MMKTQKLVALTLATLSFGLVLTAGQTASAATTSRKTTTKKVYKVHKSHYKVAKYKGFAKTYRTGYLTSKERNYTFYQNDVSLGKPGSTAAFKIKNGVTPLKVKKAGTDSDNETVFDIVYQGRHATEEYWRTYSTVYPYNADKLDNATIVAPTTPYSGKAVLPHGTKTSKLKLWMVTKHGTQSTFYNRVKGGWQYSGKL